MISSAIIQTLTYSDHFGFPLTEKEIQIRLIKEKVVSTKILGEELQKLVNSKSIGKTDNYYHLPGRGSLVAKRIKQESVSVPRLARAKEIASKLRRIPGIMAIHLTGSLAMSNSDESADIDLMIITREGRLWTTRLLLTIYTEFLGLRRRPHTTENPGKVCLNLYLSPKSYSLPKIKQSLYTAFELIQAMPLHDPYDTRTGLLLANVWLNQYLPNFNLPTPRNLNSINDAHYTKHNGSIMDAIEKISYWLQRYYMKSKITREYVTRDAAFFHPNNPGSSVLKKLSL